MHDVFCTATGANYFFICKNYRRYVGNEVEPRLA